MTIGIGDTVVLNGREGVWFGGPLWRVRVEERRGTVTGITTGPATYSVPSAIVDFEGGPAGASVCTHDLDVVTRAVGAVRHPAPCKTNSCPQGFH